MMNNGLFFQPIKETFFKTESMIQLKYFYLCVKTLLVIIAFKKYLFRVFIINFIDLTTGLQYFHGTKIYQVNINVKVAQNYPINLLFSALLMKLV